MVVLVRGFQLLAVLDKYATDLCLAFPARVPLQSPPQGIVKALGRKP